MFSSSVHKLPYITSWESANNTFNNTALPRTRNDRWRDNQRPLKDARSTHYRIEKGAGYYDMCLYSTVMARYYEPTPQGRRVLYTGHPSNLSKQYMYHVIGSKHIMHEHTTDGRSVVVPVSNKDCVTDKGTSFSADLWVVNNMVDTARSVHTPQYVRRTCDDDKARMAEALARCEPYITLACMRMPEFASRVDIDDSKLAPFQGVALTYTQGVSLNLIATDRRAVEQFDVNEFMHVAELVYDYEATKLSQKHPHSEDIAQLVTEKVLADGLWRVIKRACPSVTRKTSTVALPQFMDAKDYPYTTATSTP